MSQPQNKQEKKASSYSTLAASLVFALSPIAIAVAHAECSSMNKLKTADCPGTYLNSPLAVSGFVSNNANIIAEVCMYYATAKDASNKCLNLDNDSGRSSYTHITAAQAPSVGVDGPPYGLCMEIHPLSSIMRYDSQKSLLIHPNNTFVNASAWTSKLFFIIPFTKPAGATTVPAAAKLFPAGSVATILQWRVEEPSEVSNNFSFMLPEGGFGPRCPVNKTLDESQSPCS